MNPIFFATFLCLGALVSASEDGSWKGEGLAESQDHGQYNHAYGAWAPALYAAAPVHYAGIYAYGGAPIGADGRVVDTPEVAHATAAHLAAKAAATHGPAWAPLVYAVPAAHNDGSWKGEGLAESQDVGQYNNVHAAWASPLAYAVYAPASQDDGSWKGEGLAESQDNGQYNEAAEHVPAVHSGAAPLGPDGRVVDTPEVAHAKAAHFAAKAAAGGHAW